MGNSSNHTAEFHSFGDKNMLNSSGSNTGVWNSKNQDLNLATGHMKRSRSEQKPFPSDGKKKTGKVRKYKNTGPRQNRNGYRWDGNMPGKSGSVKNRMAADCRPTDLAYLAQQCVPASGTKSKSPAESNSSDTSLDKRDQVYLNLIGGNAKTSNLTRSGSNNTVEVYIGGSGDNIVNITVSLGGR